MERVIVFDTTLRDGEQAAGASLNVEEKIELARYLDEMGVDVIEAGFPISSQGDFDAVRGIAAALRRPTICALARAQMVDIDRAWEAIKDAAHPRIHVFISVSDIHLAHQLHKNHDEVLDMTYRAVSRARGYTEDVEFSPMDATRAEPEFLYRVLETAIQAGASTLNIPDTVGYAMPGEFGNLIDGIKANVAHIEGVTLSVHCHNDLGLAVANSLEAVCRGVRQVEGTINGIGERAGNAALEEVIMALKTRRDYFDVDVNIDTTKIYQTSRRVSELTGFVVQPNKAIVGANAFSHQSGIHQDGVIKMRQTYEIIDPATVGVPASRLVLGKLSGRHAFRERLAELGYELDEEAFERAFAALKELADKKKELTDRDIESLIAEEKRTLSEVYHLDRIQVTCGDRGIPTAAVRLIDPQGNVLADAALGSGPVDAVYQAINRLVGVPNRLIEFSISAITGGMDAIGEVLIRIESEGTVFSGRGADTDIIVASAKAYIHALNRLLQSRRREV